MKKIIKNTLLILLFFVTILMIKNSSAKAATYEHFTYEENNDGTITITKYDGTAANNIEIPSKIDGKSVTKIGNYAFYMCKNLTGNLVIPDSVITIGRYAFRDCGNLNGNLIIGNNVQIIDEHAFYECSSLKGNLIIPNSVISIGTYAFRNCKNLTGNLTIGSSVTSIGRGAFTECSGFTGDLIIPDNVNSIGDGAFSGCSGFTGSLRIPIGVTIIHDHTFFRCSGLSGNLTIPNGVTSIGKDAFYNCGKLTGSLTIPNSVTSISESAFEGCSGFTGNLVIPNSVTSIGNEAFMDCKGFNGNLVISNNMISIGERAFNYCAGITSIEVENNNINYSSINGILFNKNKTELIFCPVGKTGNITIPNSVITIKDRAFSGCKYLTGNLIIPDSVISIEKYAFCNCNGFTGNLTIGNNVQTIDEHAFSGCSGFTGNLIIPNSVTSIKEEAFSSCENLTGNLVIPDSVTSIEKYAFYGCSELKKVTLPSKIANLEYGIFGKCTSLTGNILIPDSVTSIDGGAFSECPCVSAFYVSENNPYYSSIDGVIYNKDKTEVVRCPEGKIGNIIFNNNVTSIGKNAFAHCNNLTGNLIIPNGVKSIGYAAFYFCTGFNGSISIPNSVESIDSYAFAYCSSLTGDLIIPNSVTSLGERAFFECSNLNGKLIISNNILSIGEATFCRCYNIDGNVVIPNNVTQIASNAFSDCKNIDKIIFVENAPTIKKITFDDYNNKIYYRKGTTGYTAENNWPTDQLVEYTEALKKTNYTINELLSGASRPKIELDSTLSPLVTATFDVADTNIINISKSGNVGYITPLNNGTTEVTVNLKYSDSVVRTLKANVTVDIKVTNLNLDKTSYSFSTDKSGQSVQLNATVLPEKANNKVLNWTSSNTNIATVDSTGKVTTVGNSGECVITATTTDGTNIKATCNIKVPKMVKEITFDKSKYTITNDTLIDIIATVKPSDADNSKLDWTSSDITKIKIDSVSSDTKQIAVSKVGNSGKYTITATAKDGSGVKASCEVEVNIPPTKVSIDKTEYTLSNLGDNVTLKATITPSEAYQTVTWASSNTNIATVDSTGKVTAIAPGECDITATSTQNSSLKSSCKITVEKVKVTSITLNKTSYTFTDRTPLQLVATILPENATNKEVTWETTAPGKLSVDSTGKVTPTTNQGGGMIIARAKDGSGKVATCNITIDIPDKYISLNKSECTLKGIGESTNLTATIYPSSMSQEVNWTSSNTNIATVDSTGKVTSVGIGTCVITATSKGDSSLKASCNIIVEEVKVTSITLNKTSYTFTDRTPLQLVATILPENATNKEVTWETTAPGKLSVDSTGKVTPSTNQGGGMIIARAKDGSGKTATCNITIDIPNKYISLNKSECTLKGIGESTNLTATINPSSMSQEVNWTSSNTNIATVDNTGKVTSVGIGACVITATSKVDSSLKASCNITVEEIKVTSITLNKTSYTFTDNTPLQLVATILPENATNKEVTWETTTPGTLSVDSTGKVTPTTNQGGGMIIARAKDGSGKVATCNITINIGGSTTYKKGDINKDGKVTVMDVRYGLKALTKGTITDEEIKIGDVNGDNKFSVMDARKILRYIVGKIPSLD